MIRSIEKSSRLQVNALVCNTNLGCQTDQKIILAGYKVITAVAEHLGLPVAFIAASRELAEHLGNPGIPVLPINLYVRLPWENVDQ
jgi:hypothetical protein